MLKTGDFVSTPEIEQALIETVRSGRLAYGPRQMEFEERFAKIHQCGDGVVSDSGTSSLMSTIAAMKSMYGWRDGDEVIVPAMTFVATVNAVIHCRLTPVLVDVDPQYYFINTIPRSGVGHIEEKITEKTRLIIPVHPFGLPAEMWIIDDIAKTHGLMVLEDSCECMFVEHEGRSVGAWGDAAAFSFYMAHILVTGVGGMTTVRSNYDLAEMVKSFNNHGIKSGELPKGEPDDPSSAARQFTFPEIGYSSRMTDLQAAIGLCGLDTYKEMMAKRASNAKKLISELKDLEDAERIQLPSVPFNSTHAWMMFPIVITDHNTRYAVQRHLFDNNAAETRSMLPLITQPCYDFINPADYPVALNIIHKGFYVGCHQHATDDQISLFSEVIHGFFQGN